MLSIPILAYEVHPNSVLLLTGPGLTQSQMADLVVGPSGLESPFTETLFHSSRLDLLLEEIDLAAQRLALFVHHVVTVDFGHKAPVVNGKFVEFSPEGGEGSATPSQGG